MRTMGRWVFGLAVVFSTATAMATPGGPRQICNHNGTCQPGAGEFCQNCPGDCKTLPDGSQCPVPATCGNGICESGSQYEHPENAINCTNDCYQDTCNNDGVCQPDLGEECANCTDCDCRQQSSCGNYICEFDPALFYNPESTQSCPQDCLVDLPIEGQSAAEGGYQCTVPGHVPAHSDWLLLAAGAAGLIAWRRRRDD